MKMIKTYKLNWGKLTHDRKPAYHNPPMGPSCIDLFCGCGGFSLGFQKAGWRILLGLDNSKDALWTYAYNLSRDKDGPIPLCANITQTTGTDIRRKIAHKWGRKWLYNDIDAVIGSPPCQGFSMIGKRNTKDPRNNLLFEYARLVGEIYPKTFVMENVPGLTYGKMRKTFNLVLTLLRDAGYFVDWQILDAADYGVPQHRKRVIIIGQRIRWATITLDDDATLL